MRPYTLMVRTPAARDLLGRLERSAIMQISADAARAEKYCSESSSDCLQRQFPQKKR